MAKLPDTEYLYLSTRLKAMERNILTREKLSRLVTAKTGEEAVKLLAENGWKEFDARDLNALENQIDAQREMVFALLYRYAPDRRLIDTFRLKYDYHNLKVLMKAQALEIDAHTLLSGAGTVPVHTIEGIWREKRWHELTPTMRTAALEATDLLARTGDPQLSDLVLDRAMAAQMLTEAQKAESDYLIEYVRLFIDSANLRVVVRAARAQKGFDYLRKAVLPGGNVTADRLVSDLSGEDITTLFAGRDLAAASQAAAWAMEGEVTLAALDMACDNALINYIRTARLIAFGEASVIAYLVAREAELVSVRTIMVGRRAGLSEEQIMERLRMSYV